MTDKTQDAITSGLEDARRNGQCPIIEGLLRHGLIDNPKLSFRNGDGNFVARTTFDGMCLGGDGMTPAAALFSLDRRLATAALATISKIDQLRDTYTALLTCRNEAEVS